MTNANHVRHAHDLLDSISSGYQPSSDELEYLRSFLPELPAQKTLEELAHDVYDVWVGTNGNEWPDGIHGDLETWLHELDEQLKGIILAEPAHPEFLETEADYAAAPEGTIVACDDSLPWHKFNSGWLSAVVTDKEDARVLSRVRRRVLRWGNK